MIRVTGRRCDIFGGGVFDMFRLSHPLHALLLRALAVVDVILDLVRIDLREEWLAGFQDGPVIRLVNRSFVDKVQVEFSRARGFAGDDLDVRGEVARALQPMGEGAYA